MDDTLMIIGKKLWEKEKTKVDKHDEVRKYAMADMDNLATLYLEFITHFPEGTAPTLDHMFDRDCWQALTDAIDAVTTKADAGNGISVKYGLKNSYYYLLMKASSILEGEALTKRGPEAERTALEMQHFKKILKHNENTTFGDAKYFINISRQTRLRLPARSPDEEKVQKLKLYIEENIARISQLPVEELGQTDFIFLRNLLCCRLTLFNARRGGEPAPIIKTQWMDHGKRIKGPKGPKAHLYTN